VSAAAGPPRLPLLDQFRGAALLAMFWYHFSWDLAYFRLADFRLLEDPFWLAARAAILSSFLLASGLALALSAAGGIRPRPALRRLARVGGAALLVSLATRFAFPEAWIFFGVLHCLALAGVLALPLLRAPAWIAAVLGLLALAAPRLFAGPAFDAPWLWWLGLVTEQPVSNDYVPLLPWAGLVLLGVAGGRLAVRGGWVGRSGGSAPAGGRAGRLLALLGRRTLPLYLLHQPVFIGLLWLAAWAGGLDGRRAAADFEGGCIAACRSAAGADCADYCGCVGAELRRSGDWEAVLESRGGLAVDAAVAAAARRCAAASGG